MQWMSSAAAPKMKSGTGPGDKKARPLESSSSSCTIPDDEMRTTHDDKMSHKGCTELIIGVSEAKS